MRQHRHRNHNRKAIGLPRKTNVLSATANSLLARSPTSRRCERSTFSNVLFRTAHIAEEEQDPARVGLKGRQVARILLRSPGEQVSFGISRRRRTAPVMIENAASAWRTTKLALAWHGSSVCAGSIKRALKGGLTQGTQGVARSINIRSLGTDFPAVIIISYFSVVCIWEDTFTTWSWRGVTTWPGR